MKTSEVLVCSLQEAARYPLAEVGGKAHVLGRLLAAGFDVPPGSVVLASACRARKADLRQALEAHLPTTVAAWAVRSSAAAEDAVDYSFAGQHATFLNVERAQVLERVETCWASADAAAPRAYRQGQGQSGAPSAMAVIVQAMMAAEVAGVAFSAAPESGWADTLHVEMVRGLGAALVEGTTTPQGAALDRRTGQLLGDGPAESLLPPDRLAQLEQLVLAVEQALGSPQDIEWAYAGGRFWVLQARPITTDTTGWTRANIGEVMPGVVTPLSWSVFRTHLTGRPEGDATVIRLFKGRAYLRRDAVERRFEWLIWADNLAISGALGLGFAASAVPKHDWRSLAASLLFVFEALGITRRLARRIERWQRALRPPRGGGDQVGLPNLLARLAAWEAWTAEAFQLHLYTTTYAVGAYGVLCRLGQGAEVAPAVASRSAEVGRHLLRLAGEARRLGLAEILLAPEHATWEALRAALLTHPAGPRWLDGWQAFMEAHGDRAVEEFELRTPRWREAPGFALGLVRRYLLQPPAPATGAHTGIRPNWWGRCWQAGYARFAAWREATKHEVALGYATLRKLYLALGAELTASGVLAEAPDVFFLTSAEVVALARQEAILPAEAVRLRRIQWERYQRVETGNTAAPASAAHTWQGIGCSGGVMEGRARVVSTPEAGLEVAPDEVLIVPHADPAWTPLFLCAAAVVAEVGGSLSHSATVAREFGIPAVFGVTGIMRQVRTGQRLRVDGTLGLVQVLER